MGYNNLMKKVIVGLSGGIDSSFALALLKEKGYEVIGVSMKIWSGDKIEVLKKKGGCLGPSEEEELKDAEKVCKILGVPYFVFDLSKEYREEVLDYVKNEYASGKTPNPCVYCNSKIKFELIPYFAKKNGIDFNFFATGHYAKVEKEGERYLLKKGIDNKKDQSYFLWKLKKEQISKVLFPLGDWKKEDVKREAKKMKLPIIEKEESQDFFEGDLNFLLPNSEKGYIKDLEGKIIGEHKGIAFYTIGQRKGLGISYSKPLYVVRIAPKENAIYVGEKKDLFFKKFSVKNLNWISIEKPKGYIECYVKIRYKHRPAKAKISLENSNYAIVEFEQAQLSITPGQSAVFYKEDILLGGAIIDEVL